MTEYQAAVGLVQLTRLEEQSKTRSANAAYLKSLLEKIPGIGTYKLNEKVTRAAFHFFPFRYNKDEFKGLDRSAFLDALNAEGVPCFSGYGTIHDKPYLEDAFRSKNFKKMHPARELEIKSYFKSNECPVSTRLCNDEAIWFEQSLLLAEKKDMDGIAQAIDKIRKNADAIKK
jgi:dTDP-4-amino-4,6-dideoxygalactose transaminase